MKRQATNIDTELISNLFNSGLDRIYFGNVRESTRIDEIDCLFIASSCCDDHPSEGFGHVLRNTLTTRMQYAHPEKSVWFA